MQSPRLLRPERGQALVLFSLTLLLLAVMVLMTLGFGMRAKERVEIQMAADAAAYSQAVATARTFNAIAVMNRAQIAHMVAMAGTQALISNSSQEYAAHNVICPGVIQPVLWHQADKAAASQVKSLQGQAGDLYRAGLNIYASLLTEHVARQGLTRRVARGVNPELDAPEAGAAKSFSELNGGGAVPRHADLMDIMRAGGGAVCDGAVCPAGGSGRAPLNATMGSLGWTWVHNREGGSAGFGTGSQAQGSGPFHYGAASSMDPSNYNTVSGRNSWGHDHARTVIPSRCPTLPSPLPIATDAFVKSDEEQVHEDQHVYGARAAPGMAPENNEPVYELHTLGACVACPGIWPYSIGYNVGVLNEGPRNDYGQPKLYSVLSRDYASPARRNRPDPWNLFFRFRFSRESESTTVFDNGSPQGRMREAGRDILQHQVALSAGIAYYHRPRPAVAGGGWREPPNFLNPFWRATLVSAEGTDDDRPSDSLEAAGFGQHADALSELRERRFVGGGRPRRGN
ncbi:MAG TPA: pilus assembly protein [Myxococcus sp.]|nr:pilus assembly protein [Myxococcus sp.]